MTLPKCPPYQFAAGFGRAELPNWVMPDGGTTRLLRGAVVQHVYIFKFLRNYQVKWKNERAFCNAAGISEDQFGRMRRGEVVMQMADIGVLVEMLDEVHLHAGLPQPSHLASEMARAMRLVEENKQDREAKKVAEKKARTRTDRSGRADTVVMDMVALAGEYLSNDTEDTVKPKTLEHIRKLAGPAVRHSVLYLRRQEFPDYPPKARYDLRIEGVVPGFDPVYALPTSKSIFGEVQLDEAWLAGAERCGVLEIDGHFILAYRSFDKRGRPTRVDAVRLLPTDGCPPNPPPMEPEYASSPATVVWEDGRPHLVWDHDDVLDAAALWVSRFPPAMLGEG